MEQKHELTNKARTEAKFACAMPCEEEHLCELKWVTAARPLDEYRLHLTFNDGSQRIFDCLPLIEKYKLFAPLRDKDIFTCFALDGWTVTWLNGTVDIAPEHLYEASVAA